MIVLGLVTVAALSLAWVMPLNWGLAGFLGAVALLFALQVALNTAVGFEGTSVSESLLLFNGSWLSYFGFNIQVTYRAFALPLLALATVMIWRRERG